jgi:hypothetical protein
VKAFLKDEKDVMRYKVVALNTVYSKDTVIKTGKDEEKTPR